MGDRGNVYVCRGDDEPGVYLYTHWGGSSLPHTVARALAKRWRWTDDQYLARIIFDQMTGGRCDETGYGISAVCGDGDNRILVVSTDREAVGWWSGMDRPRPSEWIPFEAFVRDPELLGGPWGDDD